MATSKKNTRTKREVLSAMKYKGKDIKLVSKGQEVTLMIGRKEQQCSRDDITGTYFTNDLPYETFGSPEEVAKAIIDRS